MNRVMVIFSRVVFSTILGVILIGLAFWEITVLKKYSEKNKTVAVSDLTVESKTIVAENEEMQDKVIFGEVTGEDARPIIIENFLKKYKSPLVPYAQMMFDLSVTYGFNPFLIPAIGMQESNLCKNIPEGSYNCWGYGIHKNGTLKFENYEIALKSFAEYLKREYVDKGYLTVEQIMKKYCPHSDGSWAFGVNHFIEEMETGK